MRIDQLEIDLAGRQWRRRSGFAGSVSETRGSLDEIPEVALELKRTSTGEDDAPSWAVSIQAPRWKSAVVLEAHARDPEAPATRRPPRHALRGSR